MLTVRRLLSAYDQLVRSFTPILIQALYIIRPLTRGFPFLHGSYCAPAKRSDIGSSWIGPTSIFRPGWAWRSKLVQQRYFSSKKDDGWYDWYKRLHADPKSSVKDLRKAFLKRAKVEHPDHNKTPGAKARFQNVSHDPLSPAQLPLLLTGYQSSCKTLSKICVMDQSGKNMINRGWPGKKAAAAAPDRIMATQPSVADSLRSKWKAEEEALRKAEDMRTREARKTAQGAPHYEKTPKTKVPKADSHSPKESRTESPKETLRKKQQRQTKPEETEEDRVRKQKTADDLFAKKKAAADKKRNEDTAAEQTRQNNRLQERVIVIRNLPPGTKLVDLLEPLVDLAPGPVFEARLWASSIATI